MKNYQKAFLHFVIENSILRFGEFHPEVGACQSLFFQRGVV